MFVSHSELKTFCWIYKCLRDTDFLCTNVPMLITHYMQCASLISHLHFVKQMEIVYKYQINNEGTVKVKKRKGIYFDWK